MALTPMQEKFVFEYSKCGNATQAYIKAGYKYKNEKVACSLASRLLSNDDVKERLRDLAKETKTQAIADSRQMQEMLTKIINEELDEEVLMTEGCGDGYSQVVIKRKKAALRDRLKAIELLSKLQGAFVDKVQIEGSVPVTFVEVLDG